MQDGRSARCKMQDARCKMDSPATGFFIAEAAESQSSTNENLCVLCVSAVRTPSGEAPSGLAG